MMDDRQPIADKTAFTPVRRRSRVTMALAAVGALAVLGGATILLHQIGVIDFDLVRVLADSDEAPIRVRNGSLDVTIVADKQKWENDNGKWKIKDGKRYKEEFEVTVAARSGAECGPSHTATGRAVVLTYSDGKKFTFDSKDKKTAVSHDTLLQPVDKGHRMLRYEAQGVGFIREIAVGSVENPVVLCTFNQRNLLDHIIILNVPPGP